MKISVAVWPLSEEQEEQKLGFTFNVEIPDEEVKGLSEEEIGQMAIDIVAYNYVAYGYLIEGKTTLSA